MPTEPNLLYKYASLENAKKIILEKKLKFTNPADFNDPFDCNIDRIEFDLNRTDEDFDIYHKRLKTNAVADYGQRINILKWDQVFKEVQIRKINRARLCCFSLSNNHPLLWSHYGHKHAGACLIFNYDVKNRFLHNEPKILIQGGVQYREFQKINYCSSRAEALKTLFAVKGIDWQYEQEYRLVAFDLETEFVDFDPNFLVGIIFGMRVSNQTIDEFCKEVGYEKIFVDIKVAIKSNELLEITQWPGPTLKTDGITVHIVSADPTIAGLMERLFDK